MSVKKVMAFGIDQSQRGFGISAVRVEDGYVYGTVTKSADKKNHPNPTDRFYKLVSDAKAWVDPIRWNHGQLSTSEIIVCREDHGFQQYGQAHLNLEIAGMIDYWLCLSYGLDPGYDLFKVLPSRWMSWFGVKKPKREAPKKRKTNETDEEFEARAPSVVFDPKAYEIMYPTLGRDEHQIDASFIAFAGIRMWSEAEKELKKNPKKGLDNEDS